MSLDNYSAHESPDADRVLGFHRLRKSETRFFYLETGVMTRSLLVLAMLAIVGCQTDEDTIVDPFHLPPFLSRLVVSPTAINTDTINVGPQRLPTDSLTIKLMASAQVSDPEGLSDVKEVTARIFRPASQTLIQDAQLHDDGKAPDVTAADGTFTGLISFKIVRSDVGDFRIDAAASDGAGLMSNLLSSSMTILRLNRPPLVSELSSPDTVSVGSSTVLLKLSVRATDPDGQGDIQKVFFNSFRPDGSPSTGNPFEMYDDGSEKVIFQPDIRSGDSFKGDGVYTLTIQLPPTAAKGTYRFEFQATDRSGAASNITIHRITVR